MKHIEKAALERLSEVAAGDEWWNSLSKKQQDAYIKLHPNSKYAKNAKKAKSGGAGLLPKPKRVLTPAQKERKAGQAKKLREIQKEEKYLKENAPGYSDLAEKLAEVQKKVKDLNAKFVEAKKAGNKELMKSVLDEMESWEEKAETLDYKMHKLWREYVQERKK